MLLWNVQCVLSWIRYLLSCTSHDITLAGLTLYKHIWSSITLGQVWAFTQTSTTQAFIPVHLSWSMYGRKVLLLEFNVSVGEIQTIWCKHNTSSTAIPSDILVAAPTTKLYLSYTIYDSSKAYSKCHPDSNKKSNAAWLYKACELPSVRSIQALHLDGEDNWQ